MTGEGAGIAVVGGSGVNAADVLDGAATDTVRTRYGEATVAHGTVDEVPVVFLHRHGPGHRLPPHRIDYRANVAALGALGIERVVATAAVGGLDPEMNPGTIVLVDQFLDFTSGRDATFHDGGEDGVVHVDVTAPFCSQLRSVAAAAAADLDVELRENGTYACTNGPRFETAAEVRALRLLGGDVVGMTAVPEVVLARELGLCYATVATVTNAAAGLRPEPLTHDEVLAVQEANADRLRDLLTDTVRTVPRERGCSCGTGPEPMITPASAADRRP